MNKKNQKKSFWTTFHKHRIKIAFAAFLFIIPLVLLISAYVSPYVQSTRVTFDAEITEESTYINDFQSLDDLEHIDLLVVWEELIVPKKDDDGALVGGAFIFKFDYSTINNASVSDVKVTVVLQPKYTLFRDISSESLISEFSSRDVTVLHSYEYPMRPLWFVTINEPTVYIRVTYTLETSAGNVFEEHYVKMSLKNVDPLIVSYA